MFLLLLCHSNYPLLFFLVIMRLYTKKKMPQAAIKSTRSMSQEKQQEQEEITPANTKLAAQVYSRPKAKNKLGLFVLHLKF